MLMLLFPIASNLPSTCWGCPLIHRGYLTEKQQVAPYFSVPVPKHNWKLCFPPIPSIPLLYSPLQVEEFKEVLAEVEASTNPFIRGLVTQARAAPQLQVQ